MAPLDQVLVSCSDPFAPTLHFEWRQVLFVLCQQRQGWVIHSERLYKKKRSTLDRAATQREC